LALDTATPSPSLALLRADEPVAELDLAPDRGAGRRVAEALHHLLGAAGCDVRDLGRVVVGVGRTFIHPHAYGSDRDVRCGERREVGFKFLFQRSADAFGLRKAHAWVHESCRLDLEPVAEPAKFQIL